MGIREETEKKVFAFIEEYGMIVAGDKVVAGVSGGADSVCLFRMLLAYRERVGFSLAVAHVNHGLRREAGEDARYVEEMCGKEGIPFFLTESDVRRAAARERCSEEDAGRRIRYRAFREAAAQTGAGKVAVAHNSDDNAETMLFHLFRGSGLQGISGIAPLRRDAGGLWILRPILCLERREVEEYLEELGIAWCRDSTNQGDGYARNRIRHHILPYAGQEVTGAVGHMLRTARLLQETEGYMRQQTLEALERCMASGGQEARGPVSGGQEARGPASGGQGAQGPASDGQEARGPASGGQEARGPASGGQEDSAALAAGTAQEPGGMEAVCRLPEGAGQYQVDVAAFRRFHSALQGRMVLELLKRLSPTGKDILAVHVRDVLSLFEREGNRLITLPFGITARRQYAQVTLERVEAGERAGTAPPGDMVPSWRQEPVEVPLTRELFQSPARISLGGQGELEFSAFYIKKELEVPKNRYTKWFDYDKMEERAAIRSRERGDYLTIAHGAGKMAHKSLKDYMISEKIPRQLRDRIPVVAFGNHVLWLVGWRISEAFKVEGDTRRVLQVRLIKEKKESGTEEKDVGAH